MSVDDAIQTRAFSIGCNRIPAGFPLVIVQAKTTNDVVKVVNFVREFGKGIKFCIASGAHSNRCMTTDAFVLDLVNMCNVQPDLVNMTVSVEGGAYLRAVDEALAPHGLAVPVGTYPWTGVGGLVLAGGFGWLGRLFGFSVDSLLEAEVVLADGRVVVARDAGEHAPLAWALRGGGGNFGVVTRFVFRARRPPPHCLAGFKVAARTPPQPPDPPHGRQRSEGLTVRVESRRSGGSVASIEIHRGALRRPQAVRTVTEAACVSPHFSDSRGGGGGAGVPRPDRRLCRRGAAPLRQADGQPPGPHQQRARAPRRRARGPDLLVPLRRRPGVARSGAGRERERGRERGRERERERKRERDCERELIASDAVTLVASLLRFCTHWLGI